MRIGIDATCWSNRRGFGRFARELIGALLRHRGGDEFVLFADRQTADAGGLPVGCTIRVGSTGEAAVQAASAESNRSLSDLWIMRRLAAAEPLDVMFFPAVYSYFPLAGTMPCIVTFHDVIAETLPQLVFKNARSRLFWRLKCRWALRRSALVATVSRASQEGLMRHFGLARQRIRILSEAPSSIFRPVEPVDAESVAALGRYGLSKDARYFLYAGGISPHKNLSTLIDAFGALTAQRDLPGLRLVLVGDYQGDAFFGCHQQLMEQVRALGLTERVSFAGYVPDADLRYLYAAAQAMVFPSYLEGFGLPAVEAMACGCPVLASDRGSLPEVLEGAGELFDPHDSRALARLLARVLGDEPLRLDLSRRGLRRAATFSWDRAAEEAMEMFHELGPRRQETQRR